MLAMSLFFFPSCNDPSSIGSDLIGGDFLNLDYTDTVTIKAYTLRHDSVTTFDPIELGVESQSYFVGNINDPVFGKTSASFYAQFNRSNIASPNFTDAKLDSVVLILPWDAANTYGRIDEMYTLEVLQMDESMSNSSYHFSNRSFKTKPIAGTRIDVFPRPSDSVVVRVPNLDSVVTQKLAPQLRIKLNQEFIDEFYKPGSEVYFTDSLFQNFFKGLHIRAISQNSGMLAFKARGSAAGIKLYLRRDSVLTDYTFPIYFFNVVSSNFKHDYTGSVAGKFIGQQGSKSDSLLFVQGMSGLNMFLEFPYVTSFPKVIINKAELEFTILRLPEDRAIFDPVPQLFISEVRGDSIVAIDDATFALNKAGDKFYKIFGGNIYNGQKYRFNISSHFQKMIEAKRSNKMRVEVYIKAEHPHRVVLAGPSHSVSPAKLKLSMTRY